MSFLANALGVVLQVAGLKAPSVGGAVETIRSAIAGDPELQKKLADNEIEFRRLAIQEGDSIRKMYGLEIQSESKFVKYARPGMLWLVFALIAMNYVILPLVNTAATWFSHPPFTIVYPELPESVMVLIGSIFAVYTGARSYDKKKKG